MARKESLCGVHVGDIVKPGDTSHPARQCPAIITQVAMGLKYAYELGLSPPDRTIEVVEIDDSACERVLYADRCPVLEQPLFGEEELFG